MPLIRGPLKPKAGLGIFTRRRGDKQPKLRQTLNIGCHLIRFNKEATRWLGIWLDSGLRFKEHHQKHMAKAHAAERRLQSLTGRYGLSAGNVRRIQIAAVQAVAIYGAELWWRGQKD